MNVLIEVTDCGLSAGYVNWFHRYLANRSYFVSYCGALSSPFIILSAVPQGSLFKPLLFNISINDLCNITTFSSYSIFFFVDDLKIVWAIKHSP
jgi:hypothetical protein